MTAVAQESNSSPTLTPRESQLLSLAAQGYTDKEMSVLLGITRETVNTYWKRLRSKHHAVSRSQLLASVLTGGQFNSTFESAFEQLSTHESPRSEEGETLRALLDSLTAGVLFENLERKVAYANDALVKLLGVPVDASVLIGTDCRENLRRSLALFCDPDGMIASTERAVANGVPVRGERIELSDGRTIERDYSPIPSGDATGGHLWHYRDVTRVRAQQAALAGNGERIRRIIESFRECLISVDHDWNVEYLNPAAEALLDQSASDSEGRPLWELHQIFSKKPVQGPLRECMRVGIPTQFEVAFAELRGWIEINAQPVPDGLVIYIRDVSETRSLTRSLLEYVRFGELVARIAPPLAGASIEELPKQIRVMLSELGMHLAAKRVAIVLLYPDGRVRETPFEWRRGFEGSFVELGFPPDVASSAWWVGRLTSLPVLHIPDVRALDPDLCSNSRILQHAGIHEIVLVPIREEGIVRGYVQIESNGSLRAMDERTPHVLRLIAECITGALDRMGRLVR